MLSKCSLRHSCRWGETGSGQLGVWLREQMTAPRFENNFVSLRTPILGGRFKREWTYVHFQLIHVDVWQKPTKFCKEIILQLKKKRVIPEGSGWGTRVYLWWIHVDIWQNQYNIVKLKNWLKENPSILYRMVQKAFPEVWVFFFSFLPCLLPLVSLIDSDTSCPGYQQQFQDFSMGRE